MPSFTQQIVSAAANGALVLTANKRLFRALRGACDQAMIARGLQAWPSAQIFSIEGWFDRLAGELDPGAKLLQPLPARHLWEQIIEEDSSGGEKELLQLSATADKAHQAAQLLVEYGVGLDAWPLSEDQRVFKHWLAQYRRNCAAQGWVDRGTMIARVLDALKSGRLAVPRQLLVVGFDQQPPFLQRLIEIVTAHGGRVEQPEAQPVPAASAKLVACNDARDEVERAARWTRRLLEQGARSIGIVVTDLQARRSRIERVFRAQIDPVAALRPEEAGANFSLSLGTPLADLGPIHAALELLSLGMRPTLDQLTFLLRTPYLKGSGREGEARARCEARLRALHQARFRLDTLPRLLQGEDGASGLPLLSGALEALQRQLRTDRSRLPGEWALEFDRQLRHDAIAWPGGRSLSSLEYQMAMAWQEKLLPALASLDAVSRPLKRWQALALLRRLASEIEFQAEAPTGPVQVVGLLESAGLEFDHLWVMGAGEEALPAAPKPNPFLPPALQIAAGMPHASAARELDFATRVVQRLRAASPEVFFSYALRDGDAELRPSPLLADLPAAVPALSVSADALGAIHDNAPPLEEVADHLGPPLPGAAEEGGTGILKDQALCPFRAFAHYRLRARGFEAAEAGLDAMTRGNLLHKALEAFWARVGGSAGLRALTETGCAAEIAAAVASALEAFFAEPPAAMTALLELERARLQKLLAEWLVTVEMARDAFQVVQLEVAHPARIGPLQIRTVVDRVDRLEDGSLVILDYKTGLQRLDLLIGDRLLEPQLPIYAISSANEAQGVAFAQVRGGACKLIGVAREEGLLPQVKGVGGVARVGELELGDWPALLAHWRAQLEALAAAFVAGEARVDPVDRQLACQYCDLAGLCRIAEASVAEEEA